MLGHSHQCGQGNALTGAFGDEAQAQAVPAEVALQSGGSLRADAATQPPVSAPAAPHSGCRFGNFLLVLHPQYHSYLCSLSLLR